MKNTFLFILSISVLISLYLFNRQDEKMVDSKNISGAYEALNLQGAARTYPNQQIPAKAHYAAWEAVKPQQAFEKTNGGIEPWESLGPHNRGGRMLAIEFNPQNPTTIYAGSASGGLWRSYTAGLGTNAWERVEIDLPVLGVSTIAFAPNDSMTMYIGTGEVYNIEGVGTGAAYRSTRGMYGIGILKSEDGGLTWSKSLDWAYNQNHGVWAVKVAATDSNIVYAATTDGTYKSINAGATWERILDVKMGMDLLVHTADANQVIVGNGNFGSTGKGIYKTTDGGNSWTENESPSIPSYFQGKIMLGAAPSSPNTIYASIGNGFSSSNGASWLLKSTDFGTTWELKNGIDYSRWQGWFAHDVAVSPSDANAIAVIGINVWRSFDGGNQLDLMTEGGVGYQNPSIGGPDGAIDFVHSDAHDVRYHPTDPSIFYIACDGGIYRSTDGGFSYEGCNARLQTTQFYNGFSNSYQDSVLCLGGLQDNNTIINQGNKRWSLAWGGDGSWTGIDAENDDVIYASSQYLSMGRSTNGGESFQWLNPPTGDNTAFIAPYVVAQNDPSILYAGSNLIAKTTNYGADWNVMNNGQEIDGDNPALAMEVAPSNDDVLYIGTAPFDTRGKLFVSKNGGQTFTDITQNLPNRFPTDITIDPFDEAIAYVTFSGFATGHVFKTVDYGESWTDISIDLPDVPTSAVIVDPWNTDHVYVGNDIGVFVSEDGGLNWATYQDGLPPAVVVFDLKISPSNRKLRIATHGNGAFERDLIQTEEMVATSNLTDIIPMAMVFPNPVQTEMTLSYTLEKESRIGIRIINAQGQLIREIQTNQPQVEGEYTKQIEVSDLVSGTYFCVLQTTRGVKSLGFVKE